MEKLILLGNYIINYLTQIINEAINVLGKEGELIWVEDPNTTH